MDGFMNWVRGLVAVFIVAVAVVLGISLAVQGFNGISETAGWEVVMNFVFLLCGMGLSGVGIFASGAIGSLLYSDEEEEDVRETESRN